VIEMQVRVDDDRDLVSSSAGAREECLTQRSHTVDAVHRLLLWIPLVADSGFDQDLLSARIDEHTIHVHADAVVIVWRAVARPELARDHSEHRTAVEMEFGVLNDLNPVIA
jgi:hypothetical protein